MAIIGKGSARIFHLVGNFCEGQNFAFTACELHEQILVIVYNEKYLLYRYELYSFNLYGTNRIRKLT